MRPERAKERLQKILSRAGVASRRAAEELIQQGRVTVNGKPAELGSSADPAADQIEVDGKPLPARPRPVVLALHKPSGYITSRDDERGRRTVMELVPVIPGLHPVGRLDYMTEGLLLLTNDGDLTIAVTHPSHSVDKLYLATVVGVPDVKTLDRLESGIELDDGRTAPAKARLEAEIPGGAVVALEIHEGRNRQVRRMFEALGHPVRRLVRVAVGPIRLGDLKTGQWRELTEDEVEWLRQPHRQGNLSH